MRPIRSVRRPWPRWRCRTAAASCPTLVPTAGTSPATSRLTARSVGWIQGRGTSAPAGRPILEALTTRARIRWAGWPLRLTARGVVWLFLLTLSPAPSRAQAPAVSVTVEPFTNLSRAPSDDWIGHGIAETVSSDLRNAGLTVTVPSVPGGERASHGAAATWTIQGAYQRVGDRLRITARLVGSVTGEVEHATLVDGTFDELFDAQDELSLALAEHLRTGAGGGTGASVRGGVGGRHSRAGGGWARRGRASGRGGHRSAASRRRATG